MCQSSASDGRCWNSHPWPLQWRRRLGHQWLLEFAFARSSTQSCRSARKAEFRLPLMRPSITLCFVLGNTEADEGSGDSTNRTASTPTPASAPMIGPAAMSGDLRRDHRARDSGKPSQCAAENCTGASTGRRAFGSFRALFVRETWCLPFSETKPRCPCCDNQRHAERRTPRSTVSVYEGRMPTTAVFLPAM